MESIFSNTDMAKKNFENFIVNNKKGSYSICSTCKYFDGKSVCKIIACGADYGVTFTSEFSDKKFALTRWFPDCKTISRAIQNAISDYEKGQKNMMTLSDLRDYILQEIGDLVTGVYEVHTDGIHTDRIKINHDGCWVCSIYRGKDDDNIFDVVFYDPFTCKSKGYLPTVKFTVSDIPRAIKNRINICENENRIDIKVDVSENTVEKAIYMMAARGSGKTRYISEIMKNAFRFHPITDVIFNDPATIVFWIDGSKTVVKCQPGETFDPEKGLAMAISKKFLGNDYGYYETFAKYVGRYNKKRFNKALEEAKKIPPDEITYNGEIYVLKNKEK